MNDKIPIKSHLGIRWYLCVFCLCAILILEILAFRNVTPQNGLMDLSDHVFSHRGASGEEIEHTYAAYDLAILYGTSWLELDLVTSKDGTLWISHDLNAYRLSGIDVDFINMTDDDISQLRKADGSSILTLEDVISRYIGNKKVGFNIELRLSEFGTQWDGLSKVLGKYMQIDPSLSKRLIIQSWRPDIFEEIKDYDSNILTLFDCINESDFDYALNEENHLSAYVDIVGLNKSIDDDVKMCKAQEKGFKYAIWTLNSTEEIEEAIKRGVDYYWTDYTAKALTLERKYR